jgi:MFS family permease
VTADAVTYAGLLRLAPARRLVYALAAACLAFGAAPLGVLLTARHATGSYTAAGFVVAAFGLTAGASAPFRGRLVDRRGMRRWLPTLSAGCAASLLLLDVVALASGPAWLLAVIAGVAGITAPPLVASARSLWTRAVDASYVRRGYAITSLISDVGQVGGPVLAGLLYALAVWSPLLICAVGTIASAALIVTGPGAPATHAQPKPMPRLRESRGFVALLVVSVLFGGALGLVQVAVPTLAGRWEADWLAGPLLAAFALGSVAGALWFGSRHWRRPVLERYLISVFVFGVLLAPVALATGAASLVPLLLVAGVAVGPAAVSTFESLDVLAPGGGAEAFTWVTTAEAAGWSIGSAVASPLVGNVGEGAPFVLGSLLLVGPVGLALLAYRRRAPGS